MTNFSLQIIVLICAAFVIGIIVGYVLRRSYFLPADKSRADGESGVLLKSRADMKRTSLLARGSTSASRKPARKPAAVAQPKAPAAPAAPEPEKAAKPPQAEHIAPETNAAAAPANRSPDNLQDIKGIGAVLEKKLNKMGIQNFDQIAAWTEADIDRVDRTLNFRGRIQREQWVEQARAMIGDKS
jgi:large subunit ribosomal protein L21